MIRIDKLDIAPPKLTGTSKPKRVQDGKTTNTAIPPPPPKPVKKQLSMIINGRICESTENVEIRGLTSKDAPPPPPPTDPIK